MPIFWITRSWSSPCNIRVVQSFNHPGNWQPVALPITMMMMVSNPPQMLRSLTNWIPDLQSKRLIGQLMDQSHCPLRAMAIWIWSNLPRWISKWYNPLILHLVSQNYLPWMVSICLSPFPLVATINKAAINKAASKLAVKAGGWNKKSIPPVAAMNQAAWVKPVVDGAEQKK